MYTGMYSNSVGHPTQPLNSQNFMQYTDFTGYHHVTGISDPHAQTTGVWNPAYLAGPREEWSPYGQSVDFHGLSPGSEQIHFSSPDLTSILPTGPGTLPSLNSPAGQYSPDSERRNSYDWIRHNVHSSSTGKLPKSQFTWACLISMNWLSLFPQFFVFILCSRLLIVERPKQFFDLWTS